MFRHRQRKPVNNEPPQAKARHSCSEAVWGIVIVVKPIFDESSYGIIGPIGIFDYFPPILYFLSLLRHHPAIFSPLFLL